MNFGGDSLKIDYIPQMDMRMVEASISLSDSEGNLLFYSNNCSIANAQHQLMENGNGLNPGGIQTYWCSVGGFANPNKQSIIGLPSPGHPGTYVLLHVDGEGINFHIPLGSDFAPLHLYSTNIDMSANNGIGKVTEKNIPVIQDTLSKGALHAVRHANGRDWWIICPEYKTNCYYKILLSPEGLSVVDKQCIGSIWNNRDVTGGVLFSPNGEKYIRSQADNGLNVFDFDRCIGELSNPIHISHLPDTNRVSGMAVSGNSRFVYITFLNKVYQYDLDAPDIAASKTLVATYDGFKSAGNSTDFYHAKLAPDGKIYICSYGPTNHLHTITYPDSAGVSCQILQHNILLPYSHFAAMPNNTNFDLGALPGPCDTLTIATNYVQRDSRKLKIYPNPAHEEIFIDMDRRASGFHQIRIFDATGNIYYSETVNSIPVRLNIQSIGLPTGLFFIQIQDKSGFVYLGKVCIQ